MIFAPLLLMGAAIIGLFANLFHLLNWNLPSQITNAFLTWINLAHAFSSFIPFIGDIIAIALFILPQSVYRYVFDIIRWVWAHVPFIGSHPQIPGANISHHGGERSYNKKRKPMY